MSPMNRHRARPGGSSSSADPPVPDWRRAAAARLDEMEAAEKARLANELEQYSKELVKQNEAKIGEAEAERHAALGPLQQRLRVSRAPLTRAPSRSRSLAGTTCCSARTSSRRTAAARS